MPTPPRVQLEAEDHARDFAFKQAMHGKTAENKVAFLAMIRKDKQAQAAAVDSYFRFWDRKGSGQETEQDKKVCSMTTTTITTITQSK